jgi:hypothetical protein
MAKAHTVWTSRSKADRPVDFGDGGRAFAGTTAGEASVREIAAATRAVAASNEASRPTTQDALARERADAAPRRAVTRRPRAAGLAGASIAVTAKVGRAGWPRERVAR